MKIFFTSLLVLFTLSISSQEDELIDATWEESIAYINKYKEHIKGIYYGDGLVMSKSFKISSFKLTPSKLILVFRTDINNYKHSIRIDRGLQKAFKKLTEKNNDGFILETVGTLYKNRISDAAGKRTWYTKQLGFVIPDDEIRAKLISAFDHLIYLTRRYEGEKRE